MILPVRYTVYTYKWYVYTKIYKKSIKSHLILLSMLSIDRSNKIDNISKIDFCVLWLLLYKKITCICAENIACINI